MVKYYIYGGKGSKIYNSQSLILAKRKAKKLSLMKSNNFTAFITSNNLNNVIKSYYKGK